MWILTSSSHKVILTEMYINSQSSDAASLHALELLMNEFFDASTNNHRKREIGVLISILLKRKIVDFHVLNIDLFSYLNVVPNSNLPVLRFFVYCICIVMWHSHLNHMEIPETKRFIPKGFELDTTFS